MFDKRKEPPQATFKEPTDVAPKASDSFTSRSTAVIGQSIKVKGTIEGDENLIVEGYVEGSVNLPNNDLTIGNSGNVEANLNAKVVRIDGQVTGDINGGEKVIVSKSGVVNI